MFSFTCNHGLQNRKKSKIDSNVKFDNVLKTAETQQCWCQTQSRRFCFTVVDMCEDTHEWCGANPGWPESWCNHADFGAHIRDNCPAMCHLCTPGIYCYMLLFYHRQIVFCLIWGAGTEKCDRFLITCPGPKRWTGVLSSHSAEVEPGQDFWPVTRPNPMAFDPVNRPDPTQSVV